MIWWLITIMLCSWPLSEMFGELSHRCGECDGRGWMHKKGCSQHEDRKEG